MRKSALSFANVEDEVFVIPNTKNQFEGLSSLDLIKIKDEALRSNNIGDYEAAIYQLMVEKPTMQILKEFIDAMMERKDFKRLSLFLNCHNQVIASLSGGNQDVEWQMRLNYLISNAIANKDTKAYREYKQFRSILLFSPLKDSNKNRNDEIEARLALADDLLGNTFIKTLVGNKQYERIDKTKTTSLAYVDVEVINNISRGDSHLLLLTDDNYVLAYGDNSKGQLLPLSSIANLDKAVYLPSLETAFEVMKAKFVFAKEFFSAILTLDDKLVIFGEGWTDRYVVIEGIESYANLVILKNETILTDEKTGDVLLIDNSMLKDYLLSETASHKIDDGISYTANIESLIRKKIALKLKNPINEPVKSIVSGFNHVLFLSRAGKLFGYGSNDKNQLCYSKTSKFNKVTELANTKGEKITAVFAFNDFSIVIDESGNCNITGKISRSSKIIRTTSLS